jgi:ribosomal protein L3 glutamine methyltransferase
VATELITIVDFIRWGASRFNAARLTFGHGNDSAIDEATQLVLHTLHLPPDTPPVYAQSRVTQDERVALTAAFQRRIDERVPAAYITGEAWFAGLAFKVDRRVLIPRSPIAELIESGFEPWLGGRTVRRVLDLCTGSGCIAIAMAHHQPHWQVDGGDISAAAVELAQENAREHGVEARCRIVVSDLFQGFRGERYDLIVSNPPYVPAADVPKLPREYGFEPAFGLAAGDDGLDFALRILAAAADHLTERGLLVVEVGDSDAALTALFPDVEFAWVEFKVGPMGVFVLDREQLVRHRAAFAAEAAKRSR